MMIKRQTKSFSITLKFDSYKSEKFVPFSKDKVKVILQNGFFCS